MLGKWRRQKIRSILPRGPCHTRKAGLGLLLLPIMFLPGRKPVGSPIAQIGSPIKDSKKLGKQIITRVRRKSEGLDRKFEDFETRSMRHPIFRPDI
jgi:hypothetical protein